MADIDARLVMESATTTGTVWTESDCDGLEDQRSGTFDEVLLQDHVQKRADFTKTLEAGKAAVYELTNDQIALRYGTNLVENGGELCVNGVLVMLLGGTDGEGQVSGFDDLRIFRKDEHTRVRHGSETVEMRNVDADELSADDFLFG